jgi:pimeloyl-ACP methyl ester carboxylesterase
MWGMTSLELRKHGSSGPTVVVLHGGPGAPGSAWGLARGLRGRFRVLEPFQRRADDLPLTVARHVEDLLELLDATCPGERPAIVGHSWGAMLALAFGAAHPDRARAIAIVGCGTFDTRARAELMRVLDRRMTTAVRAGLDALVVTAADGDHALAQSGALIEPLYAWEHLPPDRDEPPIRGDARGHRQAWDDMIRCQERGLYPATFATISCPVLMLHGEHDPHPGPMIRDSLQPVLPQLEYRELGACGHYPWRERRAQEGFFAELGAWLELGS